MLHVHYYDASGFGVIEIMDDEVRLAEVRAEIESKGGVVTAVIRMSRRKQ
jgi:uncharacterized protein with GYD domain